MFKAILLLCFPLFLAANIFMWESENRKVVSSENALNLIALDIQSQINRVIYNRVPLDFSLALPQNIVVPTILKEVSKPTLPTAIKLVKGEFEKVSEFKIRVNQAIEKRDKSVLLLQKEYRQAVEKRNQHIENLSLNYQKSLDKRNLTIQKLQALQEADRVKLLKHHISQEQYVYEHIEKYAKQALDKIYGKPRLDYQSYDPEAEVMYFTLTSYDGSNYVQKMSIPIIGKEAALLKSNLKETKPEVVFDIIHSKKGISINLQSVRVPYKSKIYTAKNENSSYQAKTVEITLDDKKVDFEVQTEIPLAIESKTDTQTFMLQNPNLGDQFKAKTVAYLYGDVNLNNDILLDQIDAVKSAKYDSTRWLFSVAIENYSETDPVIYASRSAKAMTKILQKRLGIDNRHTYALIDVDATSGRIKDSLTRLLQNVKLGDSIYFYYSGHGVPGSTGDAYILPRDKVVDFIDKEEAFKLENIYKQFSQSRAKHTFAFIDACFSGRTDDVSVFKGVAAGLIKQKKSAFDKEKLTILTAGNEHQFSNSFSSKKHRLFSYYLAEALLDGISGINHLYKRVSVKVLETSIALGDRYAQEPQLYGNSKVGLTQ
jgi:hypothetical protein